MELELGEKNIPDPRPRTNMYNIRTEYGVFSVMKTIPSKPNAEIRSPIELKTLAPYLSEK
jgi:hypothetical protein